MPTSLTDVTELAMWRDYTPMAREIPGTWLGTRRVRRDWVWAAKEMYRVGVRYVRIARPVDLCAGASIQSAHALVLIRELTSHGVAVDWVAKCADGCATRYNHLFPPVTVIGVADATEWREMFFPCKCAYRRGPGFVEVRDRRFGTLEMVTIDEPWHIAAIEAMTEGCPAEDVPADVRGELAGTDLVAEHAGYLWWLPSRVRRWPFPPMVV